MFTAGAMLCINQSRSAMLQEASHDSGRVNGYPRRNGYIMARLRPGSSLYCGRVTITTLRSQMQRLWLCSVPGQLHLQ